MATLKKVLAGYKAKKNGDSFENFIIIFLNKNGYAVEKIPSGCKWVNSYKGVRPIPVKTPFDFIACKDGKTVFFDAKSVKKETFSHSELDQNQVKSLNLFLKQGISSGYIIKFGCGDIVFMSADKLMNLKRGESFKAHDGKFLGTEKNFMFDLILK